MLGNVQLRCLVLVQYGIQSEAVQDAPSPRHHRWALNEGAPVFDGARVEFALNMWPACGSELCLNPLDHNCMGVISQCSEGWREGVYVAGVQWCAAVLNEAEHGENMRALATSKTADVF